MSGWRATKRQRTFDEILANGVALFRAQGIRRTRTESIAQASSVSAATLFNYFPTKGALAEAWVRGEVDRVLGASAQALLEDRGLRPALRAVARTLAADATDAPGLRLEAWRSTGRARAAGLPAGHPLVAGVADEQARERIRRDLPAMVLAELIVEALEAGLIAGLREAEAAIDAVSEAPAIVTRAIALRIDLVLDGARKRNERVEAPRAGGSGPAGGGATREGT